MRTTRRRFVAGTVAVGGALAHPLRAAAARRGKPLFEEHFNRPREGWGAPWFNQRYGRRWFVSNGAGVYRLPAAEANIYYRPNPVLVLDHDVADVDLRAVVSTSNVTARVGVVARASGYSSFYAAYMGPGGVLRLVRCGHHDEKLLGRAEIDAVARARYRIRLRVAGDGPVTVKAKIWRASTPEPSRWTIEHTDASPAALLGRGAFGVLFEHAVDGGGATLRVHEVVAWSRDRRNTSAPSVTYSLAGPISNGRARVVAKSSLPATIGFVYGTEPTLTSGAITVGRGRASRRALTRGADLDVSALPPSTTVYWRAFVQRKGLRQFGPLSNLRTGPGTGIPVRFAFGSCTKWQPSPRRSFEHARLKLADFYLHQGDLGYVPHRVIDHAPDTYQDHWIRMLMDPSLAVMCTEVPFAFYRDDADYGRNLADAHTLRRFTIAAHDELNANPSGPYFTFRHGDVAVFVIDCRRFSTGRNVDRGQRYKLGPQQKQWLMDEMSRAAEEGAGLLVVASPQAFGSDNTPASWRNAYPAEWEELIGFFTRLGAPVLIASGDLHGHRLYEYPQRNLDPGVPRIVEFCSAGTEQNKFADQVDTEFLLKEAKGSGFGFVELGPERTIGDQKVRSLTLSAVRSADGTPYWTAQYVIVRGVGILPLGG